jgi:hypothetical protein
MLITAFLFAVFLALVSLIFPDRVADVVRRSVGVALTSTFLVAYAPFVRAVIRWRSTEAFHLHGFGTWLLALAFFLSIVRSLFFSTSCPMDSGCEQALGVVITMTLAVSFAVKLGSLYATRGGEDVDRHWVVIALIVGLLTGAVGLIVGLSQTDGVPLEE